MVKIPKTDLQKTTDKLIKILADGTIDPVDWKINIPRYLVGENKFILRAAKNLADGIYMHFDLYDIKFAKDSTPEDYPTNFSSDDLEVE